MKLSYNWLKQYVDLPWCPQQLAERLTMAGVAVDQVMYRAANLSGVVTGRIKEISPHPKADRLLVCQVDVGAHDVQIVTAATNVYTGAVVPVALAGAVLPTGQEITDADFRGIESQGMFCSVDELGMERKLVDQEMRDGIYILPQQVEMGRSIIEVLGLDDYILELDLTPNRADCLSILGVAYEVAALTDQPLKQPSRVSLTEGTTGQVPVRLEAGDLCPGYLGLVVDNVQVAPSPLWLQNALQAVGVRPINNIVDITNYCLLELGQPLHAFDLDLLQGPEIIVRKAREGERLVTLDGEERILQEEMLVIADAARPVALAGIMGGLDSEVSGSTKRVFLESAFFNYQTVRRTSRTLGLRTDASSRFDKGVAPERVQAALERAAALMVQLECGQPRLHMSGSMAGISTEQHMTLRTAKVNELLGTDISETEIKALLLRLGLRVDDTGTPWQVVAPSRRLDIQTEIDLIEEIARLYGFESIPVSLPKGMSQGGLTPRQQVSRYIGQQVRGLGLSEIVTLSFRDPKEIEVLVGKEHAWYQQSLRLQNPLSSERSMMRPTLLAGILAAVDYNLSRQQADLALYEMANVFIPQASSALPCEPLTLAFALAGSAPANWQRSGGAYDFFYAKGIIEALLASLQISVAQWQRSKQPFLHPGRAADLIWAGKTIGYVGELHPDVAEHYGWRQPIYVAECNLEELLPQALSVRRFTSLSRFPGVERDIAIIVPEEVPASQIEQVINSAAGELLNELRLFDVYAGEQVGAGYKSLAYSLFFLSRERTLKERDVADAYERIIARLQQETGARLR